jgi:hypothetical protein
MKMHFFVLHALCLLAAQTLAEMGPRHYAPLRAMADDEIFGLMKRQMSGYAPTITPCAGPGPSCAEACGPGNVLCSDAEGLLCYDPSSMVCCASTYGKHFPFQISGPLRKTDLSTSQ